MTSWRPRLKLTTKFLVTRFVFGNAAERERAGWVERIAAMERQARRIARAAQRRGVRLELGHLGAGQREADRVSVSRRAGVVHGLALGQRARRRGGGEACAGQCDACQLS